MSQLAPIISILGALLPLTLAAADAVDHHQHLYSPEAGAITSVGPKGISGSDLAAALDAAGINRAVILSVAYSFSSPSRQNAPDEHARVMAENDWTSAQVAEYPGRFVGFCSVNPLRPFALDEIARCAKDPNLRTGLKLHFGNSDVQVGNPEDLAQLRRVFHAANRNHMAIVVHMRSNQDRHRPYGAKEARIFLDELLPEVPDVTVQICHLAGGGGYDGTTEEALAVFVEALQQKDPRMKNVYFEVSGIAIRGMWEERADLLVKRIRQIGLHRLLYGSDVSVSGNSPREALGRWHQLPLSQEEFRAIEANVAPYMRSLARPTEPLPR
jgi:predicted TIM-barrel fold metal-dependent hydrolase